MQDVGTNLIDGHKGGNGRLRQFDVVQDVGTNLIDGHYQPYYQRGSEQAVQDVGTNLIDGHAHACSSASSVFRCKTSAPT